MATNQMASSYEQVNVGNIVSAAHDREPVRVLCVSRKVIVVNFDMDTRLTKGRSNLVFPEGAV